MLELLKSLHLAPQPTDLAPMHHDVVRRRHDLQGNGMRVTLDVRSEDPRLSTHGEGLRIYVIRTKAHYRFRIGTALDVDD
jgi:hypothetical protein